LVLARERADRSLQQPGDLSLYLNVPELGVIPADKASNPGRAGGRARANPADGLTAGPDAASNGNRVALATLKRKPSMLAESFQNALTSILFSGQHDEGPRMIAITSAGPSEGKSTVVSNLAIALAEINQRVLVIDADMRRPRVHEIFGVSNEIGLSTLLNERSAIRTRPQSAYFAETEVPGLLVLPSGPTATNASNLLYSPRLQELLSALRAEFDAILIDTPPMLHLADARILAQHCDSVILVVRASKTTRDAALAALKKLEQDGTPVLGSILNDWDPAEGGHGYGATYYKGYSKYYRSST
jgi:capsular exopolysaccharide synthesis family protein